MWILGSYWISEFPLTPAGTKTIVREGKNDLFLVL